MPIVTGDCVEYELQKDIAGLKDYITDHALAADDPKLQQYHLNVGAKSADELAAKYPNAEVLVREGTEVKRMKVTNPYRARHYRYEEGALTFATPAGDADTILTDPSERAAFQQNTEILAAIAPPEVIADKRFATAILESLWHCSSSQDLQNNPKCFPLRVLGELRLHELYSGQKVPEHVAEAMLNKTDLDLVLDIARQIATGVVPPQRPSAGAAATAGARAFSARAEAQEAIRRADAAMAAVTAAAAAAATATAAISSALPTNRVTAAQEAQRLAALVSPLANTAVAAAIGSLAAVQTAATAGATGRGLSVRAEQQRVAAAEAAVTAARAAEEKAAQRVTAETAIQAAITAFTSAQVAVRAVVSRPGAAAAKEEAVRLATEAVTAATASVAAVQAAGLPVKPEQDRLVAARALVQAAEAATVAAVPSGPVAAKPVGGTGGGGGGARVIRFGGGLRPPTAIGAAANRFVIPVPSSIGVRI